MKTPVQKARVSTQSFVNASNKNATVNDPKEDRPGYDPARHHRRSIRLKSHDYAGGGVYFVTICAHREAGKIFAAAPIREMVGKVWMDLPQSAVGASLVDAQKGLQQKGTVDAQKGLQQKGTHEGCPYVVMPDHFHGILRMRAGARTLGDVVGAFKSLVVHEYIAGVRANRFPPFPGKLWHRNYYESIVRTQEAEARIAEYIRTNPWKLVQHGTLGGQSFRMIGNPTLLDREKIALLCSRKCPEPVLASAIRRAQMADTRHGFISGFHSPPERALLAALLQTEASLICCPAWGIDTLRIPADWLPALEANRMLILEMLVHNADLASAEARNRFVLTQAEKRWIPYAAPGGMIERLTSTTNTQGTPATETK